MITLSKRTYKEYGFVATFDQNKLADKELVKDNFEPYFWKQRTAALNNLNYRKAYLNQLIEISKYWVEKDLKKMETTGEFVPTQHNVKLLDDAKSAEELKAALDALIEDYTNVRDSLTLISRDVFEVIEASDWRIE